MNAYLKNYAKLKLEKIKYVLAVNALFFGHAYWH